MEDRVHQLEEFALESRDRLTRIECGMVTRDEFLARMNAFEVAMHKGFADTFKWIIGSAIAMSAAGVTVMTFVLNNATPKQATPPAPIVIQVPAPPTPQR